MYKKDDRRTKEDEMNAGSGRERENRIFEETKF